MKVSIVISTCNRTNQITNTLVSIAQQATDAEVIVVDDGTDGKSADVKEICDAGKIRYIRCDRPSSSSFRNPSYPNNVGIRAAKGDIIILQNAECCHEDFRAIEKLTALVTPTNAVFAHVVALDQAGIPLMDYCSPAQPRPYFFCGAIRREWLTKLRGFDEDYIGAGYDDDDLAARLAGEGVQFVYADILVHHQWHPQAGVYSDAEQMRQLYEDKCAAMIRGELGTMRNPNGWGGLP